MLDTGEGVPADPAAAFGWISKAAAQNSPAAQASLAVLHATGRGTVVDYAKALDLYKAAAKGGEAHGFYGVGLMYLDGQGVTKDGEEAAAWFSVGAAVGDEQAKAVTDMLLKDQKTDLLDRVAARATAIYSDYVAPVQMPSKPAAETPAEAAKAP
jgi:TPR repeat protein